MVATSSWPGEALDHAAPVVFWSDRPDAPPAAPSLTTRATPQHADLVVVGGGFTGLWAAVQALEEEPGRRVVVLEADRCGFGASSRNGGFCDASLTHGVENGFSHWPDEMEVLTRLGRENFDELEATLTRHRVEAAFGRADEVTVASAPWQLADLEATVATHRAVGDDVELLDRAQMQALVHSPTYLGALVRHNDFALVDPARLVWGLRAAAESLGATVFEHAPVEGIDADRRGVLSVRVSGVTITAEQVLVATNAYPGPIRRTRRYVIPVYDHVLVTEPLSAAQWDAVGWAPGAGLSDAANQFHYYRPTADGRILYGGYDATYHFGNGVGPAHDQSDETHGLLAGHFFATFPQLEGLRFTHRWGGPIATTTRFTAAWGTSHRGRAVWVAGYTGLGVAASRFGARVGLDLLAGTPTERTELAMVRRSPFPFPPEPLRWAGVALTRRAIQRSDDREGRRGPWLGLLDRFGIGFDS